MTANAIEGAFKYAEEKANASVGMKITLELEELENQNRTSVEKGFFISYNHSKEKVEFYLDSLLCTGQDDRGWQPA